MRERVPEDEIGIEVRRILRVVLREGDDDVGVSPLRLDVVLGIGLARVELGQDLVGGVAAPSAVALQLPRPPQLLRRREQRPARRGASAASRCGS